MSEIKNIIFDFGNVLFEVDLQGHIDFLQGIANKSTAHGAGSRELHDLIREFESGVIPESLFFAAWSKLENDNFTVSELTKAWDAILVGPLFDQEEIIRKLKDDYNLVLLSNTNSCHYRSFEKPAFPILRHFEKKYYSHKIGFSKPSLHAFAYVLRESNFNPKETALIDDRPENIEAAEELGIKGIFLAHPQQLENELKELRIL